MKRMKVMQMSKYTTELRFVCESLCGYTESQGLSKVEEIIAKSAPLIFDFDYPIFDEDYKIQLEKKIIRHYYLREIGFETLGVWKLKLNDKMNEIMPYFNQLYESELLKFNPLIDVDVKTTSNTAGTGNTDFSQTDTKNTTDTETKKDVFSSTDHSAFDSSKSGSASGQSTSKSTNDGSVSDSSTSSKTYDDNDDYSDTPQGSVGNLNNLSYLTNARHKHGNSSDTTKSNGASKSTLSNNVTSKDTSSNTEQSTNDKTFNSTDSVNSSRNGSTSSDISSNTATKNTQDFVENIIGKRGSQTYSAMLNEFRQTFLNIDKMILDELSDLFMTIY